MANAIVRDEVWRTIPTLEHYEASTEGRIRAKARTIVLDGMWGPTSRALPAKILRPQKHTGGYTKHCLWHGGIGSQHLTHKLVLWTFVGLRPAGLEACHLNGDKADNRLGNLKWGTRSENQAHREDHGTGRIGKPRTVNRVSDNVVKLIRQLRPFLNNTQIARALQIPRTTVNDLAKGRTRHG